MLVLLSYVLQNNDKIRV